MQRAYCQSPLHTDFTPVAWATAQRDHGGGGGVPGGGGGGGGGPSTGTVIGGSPGISTTVDPTRRRKHRAIAPGWPGGGGGGAGGMPLLIWIVMIDAGDGLTARRRADDRAVRRARC